MNSKPSRKKRSLKDFLVDEILKTGFPLEIIVSDLMQEKWWALNNTPYLDPDTNENRTIDIYGIHYSDVDPISPEKGHAFQLSTDLVVQCKKNSAYAWIFYTRPANEVSYLPGGQRTDFLEALSEGETEFLELLSSPQEPIDPSSLALSYAKSVELHYEKSERVCYGLYDQIKLQNDSDRSPRDDIFEAWITLTKFIGYSMQHDRSKITKDGAANRDISILFPAIIFDGKLYEAIVDEGRVKLFDTLQVLLNASVHSKLTGKVHNYFIDVVHKDALRTYLDSLEVDIRSLRNFFESNKNILAERAKDEVLKIIKKDLT